MLGKIGLLAVVAVNVPKFFQSCPLVGSQFKNGHKMQILWKQQDSNLYIGFNRFANLADWWVAHFPILPILKKTMRTPDKGKFTVQLLRCNVWLGRLHSINLCIFHLCPHCFKLLKRRFPFDRKLCVLLWFHKSRGSCCVSNFNNPLSRARDSNSEMAVYKTAAVTVEASPTIKKSLEVCKK